MTSETRTEPEHATYPPESTRLPLIRQIGYGLGDAGMNFSWSFISAFAMFYMTNVMGVGAAVLGTLMLVARLTDGVSDLLFGLLLDRTRTRWGRARPWLFWSTFPLGLGTYMLFNVPESLSASGRAWYFFALYVLIGTFFYTAANIAYNAFVALTTTHEPTRVSMGSIRFICTILAILVINAITLPLVRHFGPGRAGWAAVGALYGCVIVVLLLISCFAVKELRTWTKEEARAEAARDKQQASLRTRGVGADLVTVLRNKYFLMIFGITTLFYINLGLTGGAGVYYATYVLGNEEHLGVLTTAIFAPMAVVLAVLPSLTDRFGVWRINVISTVIAIAGYLLAWFVRDSLTGVVIALVIAAAGNASFLGTFMAYVAAVGDNIRMTTGHDVQGLTFSASSIGIKIGQGVGAAAVGWMLGMVGFDGTATSQPAAVLTVVSLSYLGLPVLIAVARLLVFLPFRIYEANDELRADGA